MIETDQQRRWWFATHPEYSSSQGGKGSKGRNRDGKESDNISPASVDAYVDERLKYEKDRIITELLKLTKFWFCTEFASKTSAEKHALLWGDEESPEGFDELTGRYANDSESSLITRLPAVSNDGHVLHIDMFDSEEAYADEVYRRATELDKMGLVRDPHTALDVLFRLKSIASPLVSIRRLLQRLARGSVISAVKKGGTRWKVGDDLVAPTRKGVEPSWTTQYRRYWKNEAAKEGAVKKWGAKNVERMKRGRAPQRTNRKTNQSESRELHHPTPRRHGGKEVIEVWPDEHAAIDPHRRLKK